MRADDERSEHPTRHGAYLCLTVPPAARRAVAASDLTELARRLGLANEFEAQGHPDHAVAYLRRVSVKPGTIADDGLASADAVVHVASPSAERVGEFCDGAESLLPKGIGLRVLSGEVRPPSFTGNALHNFAYAHQVVQQPGPVMPNAFLLPTRKTDDWWRKTWMERHTYILPRYDADGRMLCEGHALAAAGGVASLLRRTYRHAEHPAPGGAYDFVNYFECADPEVPTFHAVCAALRDVARNPEWRFVREGPTWQGRRVAAWSELFT